MAVPVLKYAIGNGASTTGTTSMTASSTSVDLSNTTNFQAAPTPGEGMVVLDEGTGSEEYAYATGLSSSTLSIPLANRGLEGTSATSHTANSMTIKGILTQDMWNDVITTLSNGFSRTTGAVDTTKILVPSVLDTDGTLAANSDSKVATQKATKTYVDTSISSISNTPKRARVYHSSNQSINNATDTVVAFNSETFDNDTMHDTVTNNSRLTITTAGVYYINAQIAFASNSTGYRQAFFKKNGTEAFAYVTIAAANGERTNVHVSAIAELSASDYIEVFAKQSSGGALNVEGAASDAYYATHFEIIRLGT